MERRLGQRVGSSPLRGSETYRYKTFSPRPTDKLCDQTLSVSELTPFLPFAYHSRTDSIFDLFLSVGALTPLQPNLISERVWSIYHEAVRRPN